MKLRSKILIAAALPAAVIATMAATSTATASAGAAFHVRVIANGKYLHHRYQANGYWKTESLSAPDDITQLGLDIFVGFQNGVGPQGQAATDGNLDSTVVEFTRSGREVRQWDVKGKDDGNTVDPLTGQVIVTVNEDANSSLYTISTRTGQVTHYRYSEALPHKGGTDAITIYHGEILISASAPGTTGTAAPQASYPAVYRVTLNPCDAVATVHPLYYDEASAIAANGADAGKTVKLALTDPDSNELVPASIRPFGGDFMLASQGDEELIFDRLVGTTNKLWVLKLTASVDDTAWISPGPGGALYTNDNSAGTVNVITGPFRAGTAYSAVTPCDENSAPATCPAPGYPPNYLGELNMKTGTLTKVPLQGPAVQPQGMIYVS